MNAFMAFRSYMYQNRIISADNQHDLSVSVANVWKGMTEDEKYPWRIKAERIKKEHAIRYPGYKFTPGSRMTERDAVLERPAFFDKNVMAPKVGVSMQERSSPQKSVVKRKRTNPKRKVQPLQGPLLQSSHGDTSLVGNVSYSTS